MFASFYFWFLDNLDMLMGMIWQTEVKLGIIIDVLKCCFYQKSSFECIEHNVNWNEKEDWDINGVQAIWGI